MYVTRPFNIQLDTVFHNRIFALNLKRKLKERWRINDKKEVKRASSIFLYKSYGSLDRKLCKEENDFEKSCCFFIPFFWKSPGYLWT